MHKDCVIIFVFFIFIFLQLLFISLVGKMNVYPFVPRWNRFELLIATFRLQQQGVGDSHRLQIRHNS